MNEWAQNDKFLRMKGSRCRIDGGEQKIILWIKVTDTELDTRTMFQVSRKLIVFKAKSIYDEKYENKETMKDAITASNG